MENNKLKELAQEFFDKYMVFQEADDPLKAFKVENLYNFLADNQWKIYADYQNQTFRNEINYFLTRNDYDADKVPNDIVESMLERVEDHLESTDEFEHIFEYVIDDYKEDLEEYKLEADNGEEI